MENTLFPEWLDRFSSYLRMRNYSPRTIKKYEQTVQRFARYAWVRQQADRDPFSEEELDSAPLDADVNVSSALVTDFFSYITERRDYKPKTLHRMISTLSSFYRYLYTQGVVVANPMLGVERPRIKNQELKYLKHSQVIRLIRSIKDKRDKLIVRLIYATGVRVSELCAINVEDIDFEEQTIRVKGKGDKIRTVFVDEETLKDIDEFIGNKIEGPLFVGQQETTSRREPSSTSSKKTPRTGLRRIKSGIPTQVNSTGGQRTSASCRRTWDTPPSRRPRFTCTRTSRSANGSTSSISRSQTGRRTSDPGRRGTR